MRTDFQNVLVEHDESVVTLTMNRPDVLNAIKVSDQLAKYHRLIRAIRHMPKPVIAAMQGIATGITVNIALACDIRIAADNARLREGFALIGLVPDGGGGYHLPRLVDMGRALEIALLAEDVSGAEAERIGLVNRCVPLAELDKTTRALAKRLANGPTRMYTSLDMDLQASLLLEGQLQEAAYTTADHREAVDAFLHKRAVKFTGK